MVLALQVQPQAITPRRNKPRATAVTAASEGAVIRPLDEDDMLLARVADGDEAAFRALVERHIDRAYGLALRILRNPTDAEDVAQDVILKV